jgi:thiosulfate dehydrogenase [quinone] large subunit
MSTETHELDAEIFGRKAHFEYSEHWIGYALVSLRVVMGWVLLPGGLTQLVTYLDGNPGNNWTAAGFLQGAIPPGNPFTGLFASMAGNPIIDILVMWGLTLTGIGLIIGAAVRWNAFWGAVMMMMFWAASLTGGLFAGLPVAHGWVVDDHLVYALLLFGLGAIGSGRILGLDARLEKTAIVQNNRWLRLILG